MATTILEDKIYNIFKENKLSYDYSVIGDNVEIEVYWGDWKHDHRWCNDLMSYIGYECREEVVTEEDGSDCYSATHYFYKID